MANATQAPVAPVPTGISTRIKRVMYATDFSAISLAALPFAAAIARTFDAEIYLLHTVMPEYEYPLLADAPVTLTRVSDDAKSRMRALARSELLRDLKIRSEEVAHGGLEVIRKRIDQNEIDLLVIGTHGRRGFERLLLGSWAEELIRRASCPVLCVGPHMRERVEREFRPRQVLFATDASPDSFRALPDAILFAEGRCELTLLHVLPNGHERSPEANAFGALMRESLHHTIPLETIKKCNPEIVIKFGNPAERILEAANERRSELIVMGARSAEMKPKHDIGVSYGVIVRATCPVLTVRGREL
jgi:nucleotide-binding universal stress UspA family protein